jgi:hypothetical protein
VRGVLRRSPGVELPQIRITLAAPQRRCACSSRTPPSTPDGPASGRARGKARGPQAVAAGPIGTPRTLRLYMYCNTKALSCDEKPSAPGPLPQVGGGRGRPRRGCRAPLAVASRRSTSFSTTLVGNACRAAKPRVRACHKSSLTPAPPSKVGPAAAPPPPPPHSSASNSARAAGSRTFHYRPAHVA